MGFVYYKASPASVALLTEVLPMMREKNMADQPVVNSLIWGERSALMDVDPFNQRLHTVEYHGLKVALLPQTRYVAEMARNLSS
jgi:hypothetical protein